MKEHLIRLLVLFIFLTSGISPMVIGYDVGVVSEIAEEMEQVASAAAERLNRYNRKERVKVIVPLQGFSSLSVEGGPLYDPDSDKVFAVTLNKCIDPEIEIIEVDSDINSREFARTVTETLAKILEVK